MEYILSIIVPVYKTEEYLPECIESIVSSFSEDSVEVLLINDGSPDNSPALCREYESKYSFVRCIDKSNEGVSATRNLGIELACGKYITFLDSDDFLHPDFINSFLSEVKNCSADLIFFEYEDLPCEANGFTPIRSRRGRIFTDIGSLSDTCTGSLVIDRIVKSDVHLNSCWGAVYKKDFLRTRKIRFSETLKSSEDTDFVTECLYRSESVSYMDITSVIYRRYRDGSATNTAKPLNLINDMAVRKKWYERFRNDISRSQYYANEFAFFLKLYYQNRFDENDNDLLSMLKDSKDLIRSANSKAGRLFKLFFFARSYRLGGKILKIILRK